MLTLSLAASVASSAQLTPSALPPTKKIGRTYSKLGCGVELSYSFVGGDTTYLLSFTDVASKCSKAVNVRFKNIDGTLDRLYSLFSRFFDNPESTKEGFNLGGEEMDIVPSKLLGAQTIEISASDKGFFRIENAEELKKLFGRK